MLGFFFFFWHMNQKKFKVLSDFAVEKLFYLHLIIYIQKFLGGYSLQHLEVIIKIYKLVRKIPNIYFIKRVASNKSELQTSTNYLNVLNL